MEQYNEEFFNYRMANERIKTRQTEEEKEAAEVLKQYQMRAAQLAAEKPDFTATVTQDIYGEDLTGELLEREKGADMAYYLGKNPTIAARLSALPYDQMIEAVDGLEKQFNVETKKVSEAPSPLGIIEGDSPSTDEGNLSDEEYYRKREQRRFEALKKQLGQ